LGEFADRTLCGSLLPAQPVWRVLDKAGLRDQRLCSACKVVLDAQKRGERPSI
jgi:hypothetical protein